MESKTNYTAVGLIILILFGALVATALWLSVGFDKKDYNTYAVLIHEAVSGLNEESAVKYNGVKVGYVSKIKLNKHDPREVEILLDIEAGTPVTVSTYATLISQGITGNTYVGLSADTNTLKPLEKIPGQKYPIIPTKPSLFNQIDRVLQDVSSNLNRVSVKLQQVLDEKNIQNFKKILTNVETFSETVARNSKAIDESLQNMKVVTGELKSGVLKFREMSASVGEAGQQVTESMRAGKSTINQISQEFIPSATILLRKLNTIAANLEELSVTLKQDPSVVIRGTTPRELGPGE